MRILQVLSGPLESGNRGSHIQQLSNGLRNVGHEVMVAARKGGLEAILAGDGIEFRPLEATRWFGQWREVAQYAKEWEAEILHAHNPEMAKACLMTSTPVVATYHGLLPDAYRKGVLSQSLSHLIAVSEATRGELVSLDSFHPGQIPVIPECLDFDGYARWVDNQEVGDGVLRTDDSFRILYIPHTGQLAELMQVLEGSHLAAQRGQVHRLLILGLPSECRSVLAQQKLINREVGYSLVEVIEDASVYPGILTQVDAVMGMGRTLLEGLATDKPVISLHGGDLGGIVTMGSVFGWEHTQFECEQTRPAASIADDLCQLLKNQWAFPDYVGKVRELMSQIVNVTHVATRTTLVYGACAEAQRGRGRLRHAGRILRLALS